MAHRLRVLITSETIPGTDSDFGSLSMKVTHLKFENNTRWLCGGWGTSGWHFVPDSNKVTCGKCRSVAREYGLKVGVVIGAKP